jgi:hypothetical protein
MFKAILTSILSLGLLRSRLQDIIICARNLLGALPWRVSGEGFPGSSQCLFDPCGREKRESNFTWSILPSVQFSEISSRISPSTSAKMTFEEQAY